MVLAQGGRSQGEEEAIDQPDQNVVLETSVVVVRDTAQKDGLVEEHFEVVCSLFHDSVRRFQADPIFVVWVLRVVVAVPADEVLLRDVCLAIALVHAPVDWSKEPKRHRAALTDRLIEEAIN
jgi:hypothetical protein